METGDMRHPRHWKVKKRDGSKLEPANLGVLRHWVESGQIGQDDLIINEDLADWVLASEVVELDDLFQKDAGARVPTPPPPGRSVPAPEAIEPEVQVPDCAFHPGRAASHICVGCGKFICEECRRRLDRKVYCTRCMAEKEVGIEPGASVGPGAASGPAAGHARTAPFSKLAIASVSFLALAALASVRMLVPAPDILIAPAVGFIAFMAALLGGLAYTRIRQADDPPRGKGLALGGLAAGSVILVGTLVVAAAFTMGPRERSTSGSRGSDAATARGSGSDSWFSPETRKEREAAAREMMNEAGQLLNDAKLKEAIGRCRDILRVYPETKIAVLVTERLPLLVEELERQKAEDKALRGQDEAAARRRFEHALKMYSDGDEATALDLLGSIVESYPDTKAAGRARARLNLEEKRVADENLQRFEKEAAELVAKADMLLIEEQYEEAARLYRRVVDEYAETSGSTDAGLELQRVEKLIADPSEREFHGVQKALEKLTYKESMGRLQGFLGKYPTSDRASEARRLLSKNRQQMTTADNLYNFGRAHLDEGKYEVAIGRYGKLLKDYPRSRWVARAREEYNEAIEMLEQ